MTSTQISTFSYEFSSNKTHFSVNYHLSLNMSYYKRQRGNGSFEGCSMQLAICNAAVAAHSLRHGKSGSDSCLNLFESLVMLQKASSQNCSDTPEFLVQKTACPSFQTGQCTTFKGVFIFNQVVLKFETFQTVQYDLLKHLSRFSSSLVFSCFHQACERFHTFLSNTGSFNYTLVLFFITFTLLETTLSLYYLSLIHI